MLVEWQTMGVSPALFGVMSALFLGCTDFIARFSTQKMGEGVALLGTLSVGLLIFTPIMFRVDSQINWNSSSGLFLVLHGIMLTLSMLLLYKAMARGPINLVAPIIAAHPLFILIIAVILGSRPSILHWLLMSMIIFSIVIVVMAVRPQKQNQSVAPPLMSVNNDGNEIKLTVLISMAASLTYSVTIISGQQAAIAFDAIAVLWFGHLIAVGFLICILVIRKKRISVSSRWMSVLAVQGILNALGILFLFFGSRSKYPEVTAVLSSELSVVTILLAWIFLKERMTTVQFLGVACLFSCTAVLALID